MSSKTMWTLLILVALAVGVWFLWKWWKNYQAQGGGAPQLGTNLNSIAPELVGGSSGPQVQPAVSLPVNITLTETVASAQPPAQVMQPSNATTDNALSMANPTAGATSTVPEDSSQQTPLVNMTQGDVIGGNAQPVPPDNPPPPPPKKKDDDDERRRR